MIPIGVPTVRFRRPAKHRSVAVCVCHACSSMGKRSGTCRCGARLMCPICGQCSKHCKDREHWLGWPICRTCDQPIKQEEEVEPRVTDKLDRSRIPRLVGQRRDA